MDNFNLGHAPNSAANSIFQDTVNNLYNDHVLIFTDGSKSANRPTVGAACVIPYKNLTLSSSLVNLASVYTAECLAVELAVDYANRDHTKSYLICTDSLSLVQSLKAAPLLPNSNRYIHNIRRGLQHFKASTAENSITIMWIPAHVGIRGNEIADKAAKEATSQTTPQRSQVPYSDCLHTIKQKIQSISEEKWKAQANTSGRNYFQHFYRKANTPWFHNKKISRHMAVWINRARAGHHSLASSLAKAGLVQVASCECGHPRQDLDHILWSCPRYSGSRDQMIYLLGKLYTKTPFTTYKMLANLDIKLLEIIDRYLRSNNIKI